MENIPLSQFEVRGQSTVPQLTAEEVYRLLGVRLRRGKFISSVLAILSMTGAVLYMQAFWSPSWLAACGFSAFLFTFARLRMDQKLALARLIAADPGTVYWAHPTHLHQTVLFNRKIVHNFITLHTRAGPSLEVGVSPAGSLAIIQWLQHHNPGVRVGAYDAAAPNPASS